MKDMTLSQLAAAVNGQLHYGAIGFGRQKESLEIAGISIDSRDITEDWVFIATRGNRVDGHSFIPEVMTEKKAAAVICEEIPSIDCTYILVQDSLKALTDAAVYYRSRLSVKIIGVVGSVGKTSTKEYVASVLAQKYSVFKTNLNWNNEIGVSRTLLSIRNEELAVIEMGISDFGEMSRLAEIVHPDGAVYTNIGPCHLEALHDLDGVYKAKTELLSFLPKAAPVFIHGDDSQLIKMKETEGIRVITFGRDASEDVYPAWERDLGLFGSEVAISDDLGEFEATVSQPGKHMVTNALAATAVGRYFDMKQEEIAAGIKKCTALPGRNRVLKREKYTIIDDCYNANPKSMKAAIDTLVLSVGRKVAILGDMFELGDEELKLHAEVGAYAAAKGVDVLVTVGSRSASMAAAARETYEKEQNKTAAVYRFETLEELKEELRKESGSLLRNQDIILIKASHGMHFETLLAENQAFL